MVAASTPSLSTEDAIARAEQVLQAKYNNLPTQLEYYAKDDGSLVLTHVVQVQTSSSWYEAFVDADSGEIVGVNDFVARDSVGICRII
jgi:extracellular elastinolytic metalloproteinase